MKRIKGIRKIYLMVLFLGAFMSKGVLEKHNITQNIVKAMEADKPEDKVNLLKILDEETTLEFKDFQLYGCNKVFSEYNVKLERGIFGVIEEILDQWDNITKLTGSGISYEDFSDKINLKQLKSKTVNESLDRLNGAFSKLDSSFSLGSLQFKTLKVLKSPTEVDNNIISKINASNVSSLISWISKLNTICSDANSAISDVISYCDENNVRVDEGLSSKLENFARLFNTFSYILRFISKDVIYFIENDNNIDGLNNEKKGEFIKVLEEICGNLDENIGGDAPNVIIRVVSADEGKGSTNVGGTTTATDKPESVEPQQPGVGSEESEEEIGSEE